MANIDSTQLFVYLIFENLKVTFFKFTSLFPSSPSLSLFLLFLYLSFYLPTPWLALSCFWSFELFRSNVWLLVGAHLGSLMEFWGYQKHYCHPPTPLYSHIQYTIKPTLLLSPGRHFPRLLLGCQYIVNHGMEAGKLCCCEQNYAMLIYTSLMPHSWSIKQPMKCYKCFPGTIVGRVREAGFRPELWNNAWAELGELER